MRTRLLIGFALLATLVAGGALLRPVVLDRGSATLAFGSLVAAEPDTNTSDASSSCDERPYGYRCMYGPINVPAHELVELHTGVAAPPQPGYITRTRAILVDAEGRQIGERKVHQHHLVWLNLRESEVTCGSFNGVLPDYRRAIGEHWPLERGYAYYWDNRSPNPAVDPYWVLTGALEGHTGHPETFIQFDVFMMSKEAGEAKGLTPIKPVWFDVRNCDSVPVYDVARRSGGDDGVFVQRYRHRMTESGRFVTVTLHLHDGGIRGTLVNETTGEMLVRLRGHYGGHPLSHGGHLTGEEIYSHHRGIPVRKGDVIELTIEYDDARPLEDVMGLMVGAMAPGPSRGVSGGDWRRHVTVLDKPWIRK